MKKYIFDIDGTICNNTYGEYELAKPYTKRIKYINKLFDDGHVIKYFTARGSTTNINWTDLTKKQLSEWGAKYNELIMGKPDGDIFIDDKGFNCNNEILPLPLDFEIDNVENIKTNPLKNDINIFTELLKSISNDKAIQDVIISSINSVKNTLRNGGKIIFAGNGGSFAASQHLATEFVARFSKNRSPLAAIALGTNSSNLTAIGNDFGFNYIFSRELEAIGTNNDTLFAFSTSGKSQNIIELVKKAKKMSIECYALTGNGGGELFKLCHNIMMIPSTNTALIQEAHITIGHIICKNSEIDFLNL